MQRSPSGKLEDAFVVIRSTQKVVANMEEDREYNACKALDSQIDTEDDVHHSSPDYEINEREIQMQMWLGGLHGCNEWAGRTGRSGFGGGLIWTGRIGRNTSLGGLGRTGQIVEQMGRTGGRGGLHHTRRGGLADGADWGGRDGQLGRRGGRGGGGRMG